MGSHNFGTVAQFKTKKALADYVKEQGAARVQVFDTSMFDNRGTITLADLGPADVIVGPDPYTRRNWYANVKPGKDGVLKVV